MVAEKISWFKKVLAGLGKRLYFRREPKMNIMLLAVIVRSVINEFKEFYGDWEAAFSRLDAAVAEESKNIIAEMIDQPILFGVGLRTMLSRSLEDIPFLVKMTFWVMAGKNSKKIFGEPLLIPAEESPEKVPKIIIPIKKCMMCAGLTTVDPTEFKDDRNYFDYVAAVLAGTMGHIEEYVGNEYKVVGKETKCFLRGDDQGELTVWFYPKE